MRNFARFIFALFFAMQLFTALSQSHAAEKFLVENGQPRAEIVIAEQPQRSTRLAAHELQTYVEKITGAKLPIATQPTAGVPVQVYVGRSAHTDRLKIATDTLRYGAYRIASGDHWLVLVGDDTEFVPTEPWARNNDDIVSGRLQSAWDKITGAQWGAPDALMYKNRFRVAGDIGLPTSAVPQGKPQPLEIWGFDERGSFNAVCGLLHKLGVRWYMPGDIGEVVPKLASIELPKIDETVEPDMALRRFNFRFGVHGLDTSMWAMRLGTRDPNEMQQAHGLETMTDRPEILAAHPEWFALYGGKRHNQVNLALNQLCYSNEELFQETVRNVRKQFEHYKFATVSVMPPDGYSAMCQCKLCEGKDSPHRDNRGLLSDYVWDFVNRVAKEVGKTHPDGKILNCAYGVYTLPPEKIEKLEPNVVVSIVGGRRHINNLPEQQAEFRKLRESWLPKVHNPLIFFENYPFTDRGWYLPAFTPHALGEGINATKGYSQGEDISLSLRHDFDKVGIAFNHFQVYFTARMYWGGKNADVDAMFREYCRLFYGPAEQEMLEFFTYCEAHWREMEKDKSKSDHALELFAAAKSKVDAESIYGQRLALMDDFLKGLRNKSVQLAQKRGPVPQLRLVGDAKGIVIDGKLDDEYWQNCPLAAVGGLREIQTGRTPTFGTTVKAGWQGNSVCFAIRCNERPGEPLNISTKRKEDQAMWYGDVIEVILATESRSYYQIAVNPAGAIIDLDRSAAREAWFSWDSQAEVATHIADDHWTVEIRIPVIQDENDPLHQVIGRHPTTSLPWHINICRQRVREQGAEYSALAPTGTDGFHDLLKFAHFYDGNSYQFDADATVTDYLIASAKADEMLRQRRYSEARQAYTALAEGNATELQKAIAFERAAQCAIAQGDWDSVTKLTARITIPAVAKVVRMHQLLAQYKSLDVLKEFGEEDFSAWPFWKAGEGYFARGRARAIVRDGKLAEADLQRALELTGDVRARPSIWLALGHTRELLLKDDARAAVAYHEIVDSLKQIGGADEFNALQGLARISTRAGKHDEAISVLRRADIDKLRGHWRGSMLLALGDAQQAAGRKDEARTAFKAVVADDSVEANQKKTAEVRLKAVN